jgi:hypothetical protein
LFQTGPKKLLPPSLIVSKLPKRFIIRLGTEVVDLREALAIPITPAWGVDTGRPVQRSLAGTASMC